MNALTLSHLESISDSDMLSTSSRLKRLLTCEDRPLRADATTGPEMVPQEFRHVAGRRSTSCLLTSPKYGLPSSPGSTASRST